MLGIHADQVFSIGLISGMPQPVVVPPACATCRTRASTVGTPARILGIYRPDTFWFASKGDGCRFRKVTNGHHAELLVRRIMMMIPTLIAISAIIFVIIQLPPGDYLST